MNSLKNYVIIGIVFGLIGWFGIILVINLTLPTLGPRWLLYFFLTLALIGSFLPVVSFFNFKLQVQDPPSFPVLLRQSVWFGIYGDLIVWLLPGDILNPALAVFLAIGLILIEIFLRLREKSRWNPKTNNEE